MNTGTKTHYENLMMTAQAKVATVFDGVFVTGKKNIILIRRNTTTFTKQPFATLKVNYHDMTFHGGNYDMSFDEAVEDFKQRVSVSTFNIKFDVPAKP